MTKDVYTLYISVFSAKEDGFVYDVINICYAGFCYEAIQWLTHVSFDSRTFEKRFNSDLLVNKRFTK